MTNMTNMTNTNITNISGGYFKRYSRWRWANRVYHTSYMCALQKIPNGFSYSMNTDGLLTNPTDLRYLKDLKDIVSINIWHF